MDSPGGSLLFGAIPIPLAPISRNWLPREVPIPKKKCCIKSQFIAKDGKGGKRQGFFF